MGILLDTDALIWLLTEPERINPAGRQAAADVKADVYVSVVSVWEMAIKMGTGKLRLPPKLESWLPARIAENEACGYPAACRALATFDNPSSAGRCALAGARHRRAVTAPRTPSTREASRAEAETPPTPTHTRCRSEKGGPSCTAQSTR